MAGRWKRRVRVSGLAFAVRGSPAPQGSKKNFAIYKGRGAAREFTGRIATVESSRDHVRTWREAVKAAAADAMGHSGAYPMRGPLAVSMVFVMTRPKSHYGTGRNALRLKPSAPRYPAGRPDLSKLVRAAEDALTDISAWRDDAQVVCYDVLSKVYADDPRAPQPFAGARIAVRCLSDPED